MVAKERKTTWEALELGKTRKSMIAACGMNCALCLGHQRTKKRCAGCRGATADIHTHCQKCVIRNCPASNNTSTGFCFDCDNFPCKRLKDLDRRYRKNYGMSMIQNLTDIAECGLSEFVRREDEKWACPSCGRLLCVHRAECQNCGTLKPANV
jgi:hypothetical protein